ncbi:hypothetical protein [Edaphobacter bradus]|uniref:hypothetical protein n=1 Tax=Edaphobacter bradus TaxID=2259016 RepID=UPI0021E02739|nr:hypothetical protein [Edaphobacter bradus]
MRMGWLGLAVSLAGCAAGDAAWGQTHKVAKPEQVVRAVGVYEWTGDLARPKASRLVPVSIYIEGEYRDAGVYVSRPVPFALLTGNVYELESSGEPKGTLELSFARHVQATDAAGDVLFEDGWLGYGVYHASPLVAVNKLQPSKTPPVIVASGGDAGKPHLVIKSPDAGTKTDSGSASGSSTADDPDRPTMKRHDSSGGDSTASSGSGAAGGNSPEDNDPDRPTLKRRSPEEAKKAKDRNSVSGGAGLALNDDPDRPTLHHGKAPGSMRDEDLPGLKGIPADMHQMVAVSDAANRQPHVFARAWEDDQERAVVLAKMQALARAKLATYKSGPAPVAIASGASGSGSGTGATAGSAKAADSSAVAATAEADPGAPVLKRGIPAKTATRAASVATSAPAAKTAATKTAAARGAGAHGTGANGTRAHGTGAKTSAAPVGVALVDDELRGFTLSYGGDPIFVYMAHTDGVGAELRYVTVVAQANGLGGGLGDLNLAMASVTDSVHLDRTPRMLLVDAVDAEASNRASLLFELRGQSSRQFALYRVIAAKPEQLFVTGSTE